jgi:hypothetical protein
MKESVVERYLVQQVRKYGGECRKVKFVGHDGAPDRLVLLPRQANELGPVVWVELKSEIGKLRAAQVREHARMRALGQYVYVIRSKWEVDAMLEMW